MILILAIGTISLTIGIVLGMHEIIASQFNVPPTLVEAFREFIRQYVAGLPQPPVVT